MVDKLLTGISQKLNTLFGDNYPIFTEDIPQGLTPPAFFIQLL